MKRAVRLLGASLLLLLTGAAIVATAAIRDDGDLVRWSSVEAARAEANAALNRARRLEAAAQSVTAQGRRADADARALGARIAALEAGLASSEAEHALLREERGERMAALAREQRPLIGMLAALRLRARQSLLHMLAAPEARTDAVHGPMLLASLRAQLAERTARLRDRDAEQRQADAALSASMQRLSEKRRDLDTERARLADVAADQRRTALAFAISARRERDQALALGAAARDGAEKRTAAASLARLQAELAQLPRAPMRPLYAAQGTALMPALAYRLPAAGQVAAGFGEAQESGIRGRGLSLQVERGAAVAAPAAGRVVYADAYGNYDYVVILDHGHGYTTMLARLERLNVRPDERVTVGQTIGAARGGATALIVELRRNGVPTDVAGMVR